MKTDVFGRQATSRKPNSVQFLGASLDHLTDHPPGRMMLVMDGALATEGPAIYYAVHKVKVTS
jgi:hypothetical protein